MLLKAWLQTTNITERVIYSIDLTPIRQLSLPQLSLLMDKKLSKVQVRTMGKTIIVNLYTEKDLNSIINEED